MSKRFLESQLCLFRLLVSVGLFLSLSSISNGDDGPPIPKSTEMASDSEVDTELFGGSSDCDSDCKSVIHDVKIACTNSNSIDCTQKQTSQVYLQCVAYDQAGWAAYFDAYMLALDAAAGAACTVACVATVAANFAVMASADPLCNKIAVADGAGDVASQIALHILMGEDFSHTSTQDKVSMGLGTLGVFAGAAGFLF